MVLVMIVLMVVSVMSKAWPSFAHNGLAWFGWGAGKTVDTQLADIFNSPSKDYEYTLRAWPLLYGTALITLASLIIGLVFALLSAIFIVEFAPKPLQRILEPAVRLLAAVPSVIYGLIGVLVLVPFVGNHLISTERKESVIYVVQLSGNSLLVAVMVLTVMITPIMVALIVVALRSTPTAWTEGSAALGVNRWRTIWTISVRAARPAIIAAAVLACARALGEAIMLSMVSGSIGFTPNPLDGLTFLFEPARPLAATIVEGAEGFSVAPFGQTLYAFGAVLLVSSLFLSLGAHYAKRSLSRYGLRP
ncbi:MAG: ABC transporter permease subunit [Solirubrobacterales bacterium]|nr:ABC transporter permease subunit [Solirubrobacterales bacterium]